MSDLYHIGLVYLSIGIIYVSFQFRYMSKTQINEVKAKCRDSFSMTSPSFHPILSLVGAITIIFVVTVCIFLWPICGFNKYIKKAP